MPRTLAFILCAALLGGCTVTDFHEHDGLAGIRSRGLINGHAAVGFTEDPPILDGRLFDGRSPGTLLLLDVWHLLRLEVGFVGAAVGVGPIDLGLGLLAYRPVPQATLDRYRAWYPPPPPPPVIVPPPPPVVVPPPPPVPTTIVVPACPPEPQGRRVPIVVTPPW